MIFWLWLLAVTADEGCLPVETNVTLSGSIERAVRFGPPNYGENPETDRKERILILHLDRPITVCADHEFRDEDAIGIKELQLAASKSLRGKQVTLTGKLYFAHTGHHHTPVLMWVTDAPEAKAPEKVTTP